MQHRSYDRTELSGLAEQTIAKSERTMRKFKETVAGNSGLDSGMRSILRDMRSLLRFSEEKLKEAGDTISTLIIKRLLSDSGTVLKDAMERELIIKWGDAVALVKKDVFGGNLEDRPEKFDQELFEEIEEIIEDGDFYEIYETFNQLRDAARNYETFSAEQIDDFVRTELSGLAENTISKCERIVKKMKETIGGNSGLDSGMRSLLRDMRNLLRFSEEKLKEARYTIERSLLYDSGRLVKNAMELELIIKWGDAVNAVKNDVFQGILTDGAEMDLYEEMNELIEDADLQEIYEAFNHLRDAVQNYKSSSSSASAEEKNDFVRRFNFYLLYVYCTI